LPATVGFFGKLYLIEAAVDNEYGWLGVAIVIGSAISLVYYLRVIAAVWMRSPSEAPAARVAVGPGPGGRPAIAGGSHEADAAAVAAGPAAPPVGRRVVQLEVAFVAVVCAVATVAFGIYPDPLFELARDAGAALTNLV
jgi:NADH-quinone oxidoreductase subunit N